MNKEIEEAKDDLRFFNEGDYITIEMSNSANILEKYIAELENKVKELEKEGHTLIQNRRNGKTVQLAMIIYKEIKKLPDCKLFGIKNCKGKAVLLTSGECISKQVIEDKIAEINKNIEKYREYTEQGIETDTEWVDNVANRQIVKVLQELLEEK